MAFSKPVTRIIFLTALMQMTKVVFSSQQRSSISEEETIHNDAAPKRKRTLSLVRGGGSNPLSIKEKNEDSEFWDIEENDERNLQFIPFSLNYNEPPEPEYVGILDEGIVPYNISFRGIYNSSEDGVWGVDGDRENAEAGENAGKVTIFKNGVVFQELFGMPYTGLGATTALSSNGMFVAAAAWNYTYVEECSRDGEHSAIYLYGRNDWEDQFTEIGMGVNDDVCSILGLIQLAVEPTDDEELFVYANERYDYGYHEYDIRIRQFKVDCSCGDSNLSCYGYESLPNVVCQ